jgi:hypothetical protein
LAVFDAAQHDLAAGAFAQQVALVAFLLSTFRLSLFSETVLALQPAPALAPLAAPQHAAQLSPQQSEQFGPQHDLQSPPQQRAQSAQHVWQLAPQQAVQSAACPAVDEPTASDINIEAININMENSPLKNS